MRTPCHGSWSNYDDVDRRALRRGQKYQPDDVPLSMAEHFGAERDALQAVLGHQSAKPLQIGIPAYLDMALFIFGPRGVLRYARTFRRALSSQINAFKKPSLQGSLSTQAAGSADLGSRRAAPAEARGYLVLVQVQAAPSGTRFGVHLCFGDLGHHALRQLPDADALAALSSALIQQWPQHTALDFVRLPLPRRYTATFGGPELLSVVERRDALPVPAPRAPATHAASNSPTGQPCSPIPCGYRTTTTTSGTNGYTRSRNIGGHSESVSHQFLQWTLTSCDGGNPSP